MSDDVALYAGLQRSVYDRHATSRRAAEALVGPDYEDLAAEASVQVSWALNEFLRRRPYGFDVDYDMRILDFGCGVGRLVEACYDLGFTRVDGVDISEGMIRYARTNARFEHSQFWVTGGDDCGGAPEGTYDLVMSFITMQHVSMRQTRIDILRSMARCLKPGGVIVIEMCNYPGVVESRVPRNHALWRQNMTAEDTNSKADVWITPDQFGAVYDDVRLFFKDIQFQEFDRHDNVYVYDERAIYPYPRNAFVISASKGRGLVEKYLGHPA
jgi:2-polyprenyl-3-methyl-5-hydroxy-6-metoxy-1,4-benzoquinol methylase